MHAVMWECGYEDEFTRLFAEYSLGTIGYFCSTENSVTSCIHTDKERPSRHVISSIITCQFMKTTCTSSISIKGYNTIYMDIGDGAHANKLHSHMTGWEAISLWALNEVNCQIFLYFLPLTSPFIYIRIIYV